MFGISYLRSHPTQYVIHHQNGRIRRKGTGLAFFYHRPSSSIVVVPVASADVPFIFSQSTRDYQPVTVQGQLTYRIVDPELVASLLDFSVEGSADAYASDDMEKLPQRLVNLVQVATRDEIQRLPLRSILQSSDQIAEAALNRVENDPASSALGVRILGLSILAIKPEPETARALETEAREQLLQQADEAIYLRRNAAVEQERLIKENELNTELAIQFKQREIREAEVETDLAVGEKRQQILAAELEGKIALETERRRLVAARIDNVRKEADASAYAMAASLQPLLQLDDNTRQLLAMQSAEPRLLVSQAIREIAQNAGKIGQLNFSPDLLESLLR